MDMIRKWLLVGLGLAALTREKAEEIVSDLVQRGEMSREEGRKLIDDMVKRADVEKREIEDRLRLEVERFLKGSGIATRSDLENLSAEFRNEMQAIMDRVADLEEQLRELSGGKQDAS